MTDQQILGEDEDGQIILWSMDTGWKLQEISSPIHGPITTSGWVPAVHGAPAAFAFGCCDGSIHVYAQLKAKVRNAYFSLPVQRIDV